MTDSPPITPESTEPESLTDQQLRELVIELRDRVAKFERDLKEFRLQIQRGLAT